jgi:hypothetical protein
MRRYTQNCTDRPFTAPATLQLLANWEHVYKYAPQARFRPTASAYYPLRACAWAACRGEELAAAAYATRRQLQSALRAELPKPNHHAQQMRELVEQQVPLIAFQRGMDFVAAYQSSPDALPSRAPGDTTPASAERSSSGVQPPILASC